MLRANQLNGFNAIGTRISTTDPSWANVVLLCGFNGANGSQVFVDESSAAHTMLGSTDTDLDTSQYVFPPSSAHLEGGLEWVYSADSADWDLAAGDFTIEGWWRTTDNTAKQSFISQWATGGNQRAWWLLYDPTTTDVIQFTRSTNGSTGVVVLQANWTPANDTWYAVCVERSGTTWRVYIDGAMVATYTGSETIFNSTAELRIGASATATVEWIGWIDEVRITKGVARYASDGGYAVATSPFPRS